MIRLLPRRLSRATFPALTLLLLAGVFSTGCQSTGGGFTLGARNADDEVWAIRCITLRGPERFQRAEVYAKALKSVAGLKPNLVQVLSDEDETIVYYGSYRRSYDGATERYQPDQLPDLKLIQSLRFQGQDVWPFILATMELLPGQTSAHPEWDLNNVEGYWSLHVAVFYNTPEFHSRRSAAEEYCRLLREQGEDAYYHHGPAQSSVCIGTFPFEALRETRQEDAKAGRVWTSLNIVDPKMIALQQRFPVSLHNGHKRYDIRRDPETHEIKERVPTPSFAVIMPQAQRRIDQAGRAAPTDRR